jgi:hypothetical protein
VLCSARGTNFDTTAELIYIYACHLIESEFSQQQRGYDACSVVIVLTLIAFVFGLIVKGSMDPKCDFKSSLYSLSRLRFKQFVRCSPLGSRVGRRVT